MWDPEPLCCNITCVVPLISGGNYMNNKDAIINSSELCGTTIISHCNQTGYTPSPSTNRTCQLDGTWSESEVVCIPVICNILPPDFQYGRYDTAEGTLPFTFNHALSPMCDEGYYLQISNVRRCIFTDTWSGGDPICLHITCNHPGEINNGFYNGSETTYDYGSVLVPTCEQGYKMLTNINNRTCEQLNTWSGNIPACLRITCSQPDSINNGHYNDSQAVYDYGIVLAPTCIKGYYISNNVIERVCEKINSWSGIDPVCEIVKCFRPLVQNGLISPTRNFYDYNTHITIQCNTNYEMEDELFTMTCKEDGTWGLQIPQCVKIMCNDISNVRHESIGVYPQLGIGEVGVVLYNSTFFYLSQGSVDVNCTMDRSLLWINTPEFGTIFLYARLKNTCGGRVGRLRPQGFRSRSQRVFIRSLLNLVNMLVGIISRPSSITCQIPLGTPECP